MSLKERIYSVLLVSSNDSFTSAFTGFLPPSRYKLVHKVSSVSAAKRILTENTFDFVIINSPLTDESGIRLAMDTCTGKSCAVLLLVKRELHNEIHAKAYFKAYVTSVTWMDGKCQRTAATI